MSHFIKFVFLEYGVFLLSHPQFYFFYERITIDKIIRSEVLKKYFFQDRDE